MNLFVTFEYYTFMKKYFINLFFFLLCMYGCTTSIADYGKHYQKHQDFASLDKVVELIDLGIDTAEVRKLLGEPIDMGFDYRYLVDSIGENGCVVGAVFHIDESGKIDQKWTGEICE